MSGVSALMARISPRERRTILLGASIALGAWLALKGVPAAARHVAGLRERSTAASLSLEQARRIIETAPAARESLTVRARELVSLAPRLLAGGTSAEASAELAALVGGIAAVRRVRIIQQDARPDSSASVFTRVTLRLSAEGDVAGIAGMVADLEEGVKLLRVRSIAISAPEPASPATQPERLRADLVVEGWAGRRSER